MKKLFTLLVASLLSVAVFAQHTISINLTTDRYGSETSWQVFDVSAGTVVAHGGPYNDLTSAGTTVQNIPDINVDGNGCYVFAIYDAYGDGICCQFGNGSYSVSYDGVVKGSGGSNFTSKIHKLNAESASCPGDEISLESVKIPKYAVLNQPFSVGGMIYNGGMNTVSSYKVKYRIDGGAWSADFTVNTSLQSFAQSSFTHNVPVNLTSTGMHTIEIEAYDPNGNADDESDNIMSAQVFVNQNSVERKPLLEHFSTAQCPNCPPAHTKIESYLNTRPNVIHLIHHAGYGTDNYTVSESQAMLVFYNDGGSTYAPAVMIDRTHLTVNDPGPVFFPGESYPVFASFLDERLATPAFITVNINGNYDPSTRQLALTVSGNVVGDLTWEQNLRLSVFIMEDGLVGSQQGASGSYTHNNVMRDAISSTWGDANVVTSNAGSYYSKTYNYTLNSDWNVNKLSIIAFVNNHNSSNVNDREILNANCVKLSELQPTAIRENNTFNTYIYPNPAENELNISTEGNVQRVEIFNMQGQFVKAQTGDVHVMSISDLSAGMYIVKVTCQEGVSTQKLVKR